MPFPFEGMGVDQTWTLAVPKSANPGLKYDAVADIQLTIDYTALSDPGYRQLVIQSPSTPAIYDGAFSFPHQFADAWYELHNPEESANPMVVRFDTTREDFPSNVQNLRIEQLM